MAGGRCVAIIVCILIHEVKTLYLLIFTIIMRRGMKFVTVEILMIKESRRLNKSLPWESHAST